MQSLLFLFYFTLRRTVWLEFIIIFWWGRYHIISLTAAVYFCCLVMLAHAQCRPGRPAHHTDAHMRRSTGNRAVYFCCLQVWLLGDIGTCVVHKWHGRNYSLDPLRPSILRRWFLTTMLYVTMILHNTVTMRRSARIEVFSLDTDLHTHNRVVCRAEFLS